MKKNTSFLIKKQRSPKVMRALFVAACLFIVSLASAIYLFGQWRAGYLSTNYKVTFKELNKEIDNLRKDRNEYLSQSADLEASLKIEQEVVEDLRERLEEINGENSELKEELAFYTSLLDPAQQKAGLHIKQYSVSTNPFTGALQYRLVLAQVRGGDRFVSGTVSFEIKGSQDDEVITLPMNQVVATQADKEDFRFKYFQAIEGELNLPVNFTPSDVRVLMEPKSKKFKSITKVYAWNAVTSRGEK